MSGDGRHATTATTAKFSSLSVNNRFRALSKTPAAWGNANAGRTPNHGRARLVSAKVSAPKPLNLPSLRSEHGGQDPSLCIVPLGTSGWGGSGGGTSGSGMDCTQSSSISVNGTEKSSKLETETQEESVMNPEDGHGQTTTSNDGLSSTNRVRTWAPVEKPTVTHVSSEFPVASEVNKIGKEQEVSASRATSKPPIPERKGSQFKLYGNWDEDEDVGLDFSAVVEFGDGTQVKVEPIKDKNNEEEVDAAISHTGSQEEPQKPQESEVIVRKEDRFSDDYDRNYPHSTDQPRREGFGRLYQPDTDQFVNQPPPRSSRSSDRRDSDRRDSDRGGWRCGSEDKRTEEAVRRDHSSNRTLGEDRREHATISQNRRRSQEGMRRIRSSNTPQPACAPNSQPPSNISQPPSSVPEPEWRRRPSTENESIKSRSRSRDTPRYSILQHDASAQWRQSSERPPPVSQLDQARHPSSNSTTSSRVPDVEGFVEIDRPPEITQMQKEYMLSAAERAKKRREEEEAERRAMQERARLKLKEIEERLKREQESAKTQSSSKPNGERILENTAKNSDKNKVNLEKAQETKSTLEQRVNSANNSREREQSIKSDILTSLVTSHTPQKESNVDIKKPEFVQANTTSEKQAPSVANTTPKKTQPSSSSYQRAEKARSSTIDEGSSLRSRPKTKKLTHADKASSWRRVNGESNSAPLLSEPQLISKLSEESALERQSVLEDKDDLFLLSDHIKVCLGTPQVPSANERKRSTAKPTRDMPPPSIQPENFGRELDSVLFTFPAKQHVVKIPPDSATPESATTTEKSDLIRNVEKKLQAPVRKAASKGSNNKQSQEIEASNEPGGRATSSTRSGTMDSKPSATTDKDSATEAKLRKRKVRRKKERDDITQDIAESTIKASGKLQTPAKEVENEPGHYVHGTDKSSTVLKVKRDTRKKDRKTDLRGLMDHSSEISISSQSSSTALTPDEPTKKLATSSASSLSKSETNSSSSTSLVSNIRKPSDPTSTSSAPVVELAQKARAKPEVVSQKKPTSESSVPVLFRTSSEEGIAKKPANMRFMVEDEIKKGASTETSEVASKVVENSLPSPETLRKNETHPAPAASKDSRTPSNAPSGKSEKGGNTTNTQPATAVSPGSPLSPNIRSSEGHPRTSRNPYPVLMQPMPPHTTSNVAMPQTYWMTAAPLTYQNPPTTGYLHSSTGYASSSYRQASPAASPMLANTVLPATQQPIIPAVPYSYYVPATQPGMHGQFITQPGTRIHSGHMMSTIAVPSGMTRPPQQPTTWHAPPIAPVAYSPQTRPRSVSMQSNYRPSPHGSVQSPQGGYRSGVGRAPVHRSISPVVTPESSNLFGKQAQGGMGRQQGYHQRPPLATGRRGGKQSSGTGGYSSLGAQATKEWAPTPEPARSWRTGFSDSNETAGDRSSNFRE
ncbi:uncharacterized protein VTP21DRAFT_11677 [Calcarisporiella thermophila]|uniref:uncharacterized protein n=1 Tax=Calcarisporiella thermophila TaxID=911321 RepID=UPI0037445208